MARGSHTRLRSRFRPLEWDLGYLAERAAAVRGAGIISEKAESTLYPIRALRYWWLACALREEVGRREQVTVGDFGSSHGHLKRFFGASPQIDWIAFDRQLDDRALRKAGYSELVRCDFDAEIPWPSDSIDVGVFSHVVEHLPNPERAIREIARVLRPGGVLLAGSPVVPYPFSRVRDWQHRRLYRQGKFRGNGHINSMDTARWTRLLSEAGLEVEMMHGAFFFRWSGSPLENSRTWIRINQAWGCLLPSCGGEVYLAARRVAGDAAERSPRHIAGAVSS